MPDLDITVAEGPTTVFSLLRDARPILLNLVRPNRIDIVGWKDRIKLVEATFEGRLELPVIGQIDTPATVLIRPDGHVAWAGDGTAEGLNDALTCWLGQPAEA
jgi:3-(3-hydroxy-phenyl)propionate hydroxylase